MQTSIKDVAKCLMSRKAMLDFVEWLCELHKFNFFFFEASVWMLGCVYVHVCFYYPCIMLTLNASCKYLFDIDTTQLWEL